MEEWGEYRWSRKQLSEGALNVRSLRRKKKKKSICMDGEKGMKFIQVWDPTNVKWDCQGRR